MIDPIQENFHEMLARLEREHGPKSAPPEPDPDEAAPRAPAPVVSLPHWAANKRGVPHAVLRSALFAAIQGPARQYLEGKVLVAQGDIEIKLTGQQLNQSDLDVWEQVLHLAQRHPLGTQCEFTMRGFLRGLGRQTNDHRWVYRSLIRLAGSVVEIKQGSHLYVAGLMSFHREEETGRYTLEVNPEIIKLYTPGHWTAIDRGERQKLRGKPLALWLHGFYASHLNPYPVSVAYLHGLSGSNTKSRRAFKQNLVSALKELKGIGAIRSFEIVDHLVYVKKRKLS